MDPAIELRLADRHHLDRAYPAAIAAYRRALAGDAGLYEAWYGLGCASLTLGDHAQAAEALLRTVAVRPDAHGARCNLAEALFHCGAIDAAIAQYQHAFEHGSAEMRAVALAGIACIAPGGPAQDNAGILAARQRWIAHATRGIRPLSLPPRVPDGTLRIGYLGAFFGDRNWMKNYMGTINAHDRDRFEVHFLADGAAPCAEAGYRDHPDDRIWEIAGVSNADLAQHIAAAGLDVLVDLNGYSHQSRLPLFAYRAARRQICWMGMYGTTGLGMIDALVGDAAVILPDEEQFYAEPIVRVPGTYFAFQVFYPTPEIVPPPSLASRRLTFGCLSSAYKLTEPTVAGYAAILREAPTATLLLRNRALDQASNRAAVLDRFTRLGVAADRLILEGGAPHEDFLRSYDRIDVALDSFPYNGGTTTVEALWQGVPMLTCNGDRWAARTSRTILLAAGLADWVAPDLAGFQDAAIRLANDPATPERLAALRATMRVRLRASATCDVTGLCRALEALYGASGKPA